LLDSQDGQYTYNLILRGLHAIIVAVKKH